MKNEKTVGIIFSGLDKKCMKKLISTFNFLMRRRNKLHLKKEGGNYQVVLTFYPEATASLTDEILDIYSKISEEADISSADKNEKQHVRYIPLKSGGNVVLLDFGLGTLRREK